MDRSNSILDRKALEKLKRIAPTFIAARQDTRHTRDLTLPCPDEIAFKLTNRCDLRCKHCYQWKPDGYHQTLDSKTLQSDLPVDMLAEVLAFTSEVKSNVFLWGGEPLVYRHWNEVTELLERNPRWTSICTNGTLIRKRIDTLLRISEQLEMSISIDGLQDQHDRIRGAGTFDRTLSGMRLLVDEKRRGNYLGEVTVNCVISNGILANFMAFLEFLETEGVETVYVSLPWFLSRASCKKMDAHFHSHLSWLSRKPCNGNSASGSWYSYNYGLNPDQSSLLLKTIENINSHPWQMKIRYNPEISTHEIDGFIGGSDVPAQNKTRCNAIYSRMDIFPNGDVVSCKFFPELVMGNLSEQDLEEIWKGSHYQKFRQTIESNGLMPVCAKCNLLYTRGS